MKAHDLDDFFETSLVPAGIGAQKARIQLMAMQARAYLKTGITAIDRHLRLVPTEFTLIGGRAGTGKTALGMQVVANVLRSLRHEKAGGSVAVFSAEMSTAQIMLREAAAATNIPLQRLTLGEATDEEYAAIDKALRGRQDAGIDNLYIDESPSPTLEHMVEQLSALQAAAPVRLVMFDYMELAGEFGQNQTDRVAKISKGLKSIAKRLEVPVVALTQLNRDIEKRPDKKILLSDFMYGGEQSADIILGLLRPHQYDQAQPRNLVEAHLVKYRNGVSGIVEPLVFDDRTLRFSTGYLKRTGLND